MYPFRLGSVAPSNTNTTKRSALRYTMTLPASSDVDTQPISNLCGPGDDYSEESDPDFDLLSVKSLPDRQTISLSVRAAYTNWNPREAFRELVQNW